MDNKLIRELEAVLPAGMTIPDALKQLYDWIWNHRLFVENETGTIGFLFPEQELQAGWTDTGRRGGTAIEFMAGGNANLHYWFGADKPEINQRLCVFGQTGGDGSECALWVDDAGQTRIVHFGSGSGSTLSCVLADNAVDFLRLLAIGYDEICWNDAFAAPPNADPDFIVEPNVAFQQWVKTTFNTTIPRTALEIVKHPALMDDEHSEDDFFNWYKLLVG